MNNRNIKSLGGELALNLPLWHDGMNKVWDERKQTNLVCAHRGWWKSSMAIRQAIEHVAPRELELGPCEAVGWYSHTWKPILNVWKEIKLMTGNNDDLFNKTDHTFTIPGGESIYFYSMEDPDNARGPTFTKMILDEAGELEDGVRSKVLYPILLKTLATGGKADFWEYGTPNTRNPKNDFWNLIISAKDHLSTKASWIIPCNADIDENENLFEKYSPYANPNYQFQVLFESYREAQELNTHRDWQVEWLCKFISTEGGQFEDPELICTLKWEELGTEPSKNAWYQGGVDVANTNDYTVICAMDRNTQKQVYQKRFTRCAWERVYREIQVAMERYPGIWKVDANGAGSQVPEEMSKRGFSIEGVKWQNRDKQDMMDHLSMIVAGKKLRLFNDLQTIKELVQMNRKKSPTGLYVQIGAPKGQHDDICTALALMVKDWRPSMIEMPTRFEDYMMAHNPVVDHTFDTW